ncbi:DUF1700 domain-containing protein [Lentilactobacillus sp. SPB1-3]|uniref:DUF1700 domain-containing protein n=1 Tax=Lentilactobacillus terminaliae TaxID=3003483 RepID=A0ACD5DGF2_9LACO|nr:DUF1700 domain-containing protein [Lentilactobacillus sp. SPB1-3]MCZ0976728.1 DUF1700 domain-containing protein [Lentilactobacillus sp. SPB1-3]
MDRYIDELTVYLRDLNDEERQDAVDFYSEYLQDGNLTGYDEAVNELGQPKQLARKILADYSIKENDAVADSKQANKKPKSDAKTIWLITGALLSTPVTIPIAIALVATGIGLLIAVLGIALGLALLLIGLLIAAAASVFAGITLIPTNGWIGMYYLGIGLVIFGIFTIAIPLGKWIVDWIVHLMSKLSKWVYSKVVSKRRA